jgi:Na+/H+ antiporter
MVPPHLLVFLAVAVAVLGATAVLRRRMVPTAVVLVVAGLVIGFLPFVPDVSLRPDDVLLGLLPVLIFDAAINISPSAVAQHAEAIGYLAAGLTLVTAATTAAAVHWAGHVPWATAFVLGTAVAPTDAAATIGIARRAGLPPRLSTILSGEALFNDAIALVLYAAAVTAATTAQFSPLRTAASIVYASLAGVAIGLIVGVVGSRLRRAFDDPPIEIAGSLLLAYVAYLPALALHASGVLAVATLGLYLNRSDRVEHASPRSRMDSRAFRGTLVFLIDSTLFVLVGMSFHAFIARSEGPVLRLTITAALVIATVIAVRIAWLEAGGALARHRRRRGGRRTRGGLGVSGWQERLVLGWSGMRGAITLAALLAVPTTTSDGRLLGHRDDIIYLGFAVILATLIAQGLTMPLMIRRLHGDSGQPLRQVRPCEPTAQAGKAR